MHTYGITLSSGSLNHLKISSEMNSRKTFEMQLTPREREIWRILASTGESNQEIASQLEISKRTLEKHLKTLSLKLGFLEASRAKLVVAWYKKKRR